MSIDTNLLALFRTLMSSYDTTVDTGDSSEFYQKVMSPLLTRVGGDILASETESFLADFVSENHGDLDTSEFSGIRDLVIRPMSTMLEPIKREVDSIRQAQSFSNPDSLTNDEINALLSNFFLEKVTGSSATGTVRVFFNTPVDVNTSGAIFTTTSGLEYVPAESAIFTASQVSFNVSGSQFYVDILAVANNVGSSYNIPVSQITSVEGIPSAASAENITSFTGGADSESNTQAIQRAKDSVTVQNLVTKSGINLVLTTNFSGVSDIHTVGFGESDMLRDIVDGPATVSNVPGGVYTQTSKDIPAGGIHVGGKTDVYLYDGNTTGQVTKSLSVSNITDVGVLIISGQSGYVLVSGAPQTFYDKTGYFDTRGVAPGDLLYVDSAAYTITTVSSTSIVISTALPSLVSSVKYEIRRVSADASIRVPLHRLSALDSNGLTAISASSSTTPASPIPGDPSLLPLTNSSGNVAKTENVVQIVDASSAGNIIMPVFDISTVQLGAGSGAYTDLGKIALAEVLEVTAPSGFTGADGSTGIAKGKLRVYVRDKVNILAVPTIQATTDGSSGSYSALSIERNGNHKDTKTNQRYTGPIYKNGIYKYGIQSVQKDSSQTNPWTWSYAYAGVLNTSPSADTGSTGVANGNFFYIDRSVTYAVNPQPGMWVWNAGSSTNRRFQLMQIISVSEVTGTKSNGYTGSNTYYECRVRSESNTVPEFTGTGSETFNLYQGVLGENLTFDSNYNLYYTEFDAYCLNSNDTASNISSASEVTLERHVNEYNSTGTDAYIPFKDGLDGDNHDFYLEGYKLRSRTRGFAYSTKEEPFILLTNFVTLLSATNVASSSTRDLSDTSVSYAMKISYISGVTVASAQSFVDRDANRIVGEDMLIKPFLPAVAFGKVTGKGLTAVTGNTLLKTYISSLKATETLELSDLINFLYANNANYISLPLSLYVIRYSQERRVSGERVTTKSTLSELERFFTVTTNAGQQSINFTVET